MSKKIVSRKAPTSNELTTHEALIKDLAIQADQENYLAEVHYLPIWPEDKRGLANTVVRSNLFTVRNKKVKREGFTQKPLFVIGKEGVRYTGAELRAQDDELIYAQVLQYAQGKPLGEWVEFSGRQLCKDVGWSINGGYVNKAKECLIRLRSGVLAIESQRLGVWSGKTINLIDEFEFEGLQRWRVCFHPAIAKFFGECHYTHLEWNTYRKLTPIARRLYDYVASHSEPYPLKLETLKELCGSEADNNKSWREKIIRAMKKLADTGLVKEWKIDKGVLSVKRA